MTHEEAGFRFWVSLETQNRTQNRIRTCVPFVFQVRMYRQEEIQEMEKKLIRFFLHGIGIWNSKVAYFFR
jgi:hypothetical protein